MRIKDLVLEQRFKLNPKSSDRKIHGEPGADRQGSGMGSPEQILDQAKSGIIIDDFYDGTGKYYIKIRYQHVYKKVGDLENMWTVSFVVNSKHSKPGFRETVNIFNGVVESLGEFLQVMRPDALTFFASAPARDRGLIQLYNRMINNNSGPLNDLRYSIGPMIEHPGENSRRVVGEWKLTRIE